MRMAFCVAILSAAACIALFVPCLAEGAGKPNIIFVLADDLGWAELGCYGNTFNETPNLDKLAARGVRFTDAYAAAPVCSPFRASLISGQWPARVGITDYLRPNDAKHPLVENSNSVADVLHVGQQVGTEEDGLALVP